MDGILCLLVFLAAVINANDCMNDKNGASLCSNASNSGYGDVRNWQASIAFGFFTFLALLILNVIDFFEHRSGEKDQKQQSQTQKA